MRRSRIATVLALTLCIFAGRRAIAQVVSPPTPIYHGVLGFLPAKGKIDRATGTASLKVQHARFLLSPTSDGIFPDREPILIALGPNNTFGIDAGMLKPSHKGKVLTYRAPKSTTSGILSFRIWQIAGPGAAGASRGAYGLRFTLKGLNVALLNVQDPLCLPMAVIVGDDDGFSGVVLTSPSFQSKTLSVPRDCNAGGNWPWLGR
ncbi:MAG TPA: hypothetical protein VE911_03830 [Candidatus Nitrosopolaris sp.]|nr:hypothetical protein [Candidatus Nitrosopolaris sp.]